MVLSMMDKIRQMLNNELMDTHCHLNDASYDSDREEQLTAAKTAGVTKVIDIAVDLASSRKILAAPHAMLIPTVGIDPECLVPGSDLYLALPATDFDTWLTENIAELTILAKQASLIGECGIDLYWLHRQVRDGKLSQVELEQSYGQQEQLFRAQCELASAAKLPIAIHSRSAEAKCLEILNDYNLTAIFHSYTGGYKVAKRIIDKGHYLGVNGIITYQSAEQLRAMYLKLLGKAEEPSPAWFYDRHIVFETDAPFLHPFDASKRNVPSQVKIIYNHLAELIITS